ncbi:MAG: BPSS1780 family membrane protein [Pseudomonadota bacterium]
MKLNIVPARTGLVWVKLGIRTFFKQPLALSGLFFLFITMMSLASLIPFIGGALALALLPAATLGLMAASREAETGKFPMPLVLLSAFRAGRQRLQAMLVLGAFYALGFVLVMGVSALFDGGQFARLYLVGGRITDELVSSPDFKLAMWVALGLYLPLSLTFWHAPALVHWHGVPPLQSMFYSAVACTRNFWALTIYALVWLGVFLGVGMVVSVVGVLLGSAESVAAIMLPVALLLAAMFFASLYFTFRDSFDTELPASTETPTSIN